MLPPLPGMRAPLLLRFGLFIYDMLGAAQLLPARAPSISRIIGRPAAQRSFRYGFEYSDCWVDDSRLVLLNAMDAANAAPDIRRAPAACVWSGATIGNWCSTRAATATS